MEFTLNPIWNTINTYVKEGEIRNCAGNGKCGYTSREELSVAYTQMLLHDKHNGQTYNLAGDPITQTKLAELINQVFNTNLIYHSVSVEAYEKERKAVLGDLLEPLLRAFTMELKWCK